MKSLSAIAKELGVSVATVWFGWRHPHEVLLAGFDEPMETWATDVVRNVIKEPLLVVQQDAAEMGRVAVDLAQSTFDGADTSKPHRFIRPILSWEDNGENLES